MRDESNWTDPALASVGLSDMLPKKNTLRKKEWFSAKLSAALGQRRDGGGATQCCRSNDCDLSRRTAA